MLYFVINNCNLIVAYLNYLWGIKILDIKLALKLSLGGIEMKSFSKWGGVEIVSYPCIDKGGLEQV